MNLLVDALFGTRWNRNGPTCDSEDWNDVTFTGQRIRWMKDSQSGSCIEVSQQIAVEEMEEISVERNTKENLHCTPAIHIRYRSLLGQIIWLPSRTQFL